MVNVLVCVKRVPGTSGEILLTPDGMSVDARYVGYMLSPHEECAVELAIQVASATDGIATVLSLGSDDSIEQMRDALAVGCKAGVLIEADAAAYGPGDVAAAIAEVVRAARAAGAPAMLHTIDGVRAADHPLAASLIAAGLAVRDGALVPARERWPG